MQSDCGLLTAPPDKSWPSTRFRIHVLFTTFEDTRIALQHATRLASGLNAEVSLILAPIVPFPLPLDQPPTSVDFAQEQIGLLADSVEGDIEVAVYLCRDPDRLLAAVLPPHALIFIGAHGHWPFARSRRLARCLSRRGHQVITTTR
jgi:hypothetical protein